MKPKAADPRKSPDQFSKDAAPRVAIVHEWLTAYAGSEKVFEQLLQMFPQADLFCLVDFLHPKERGFLQGRHVKTSFLQGIPFGRTLFRKVLWLLPLAIENFDLSGYDIVLTSSHAVAKGAITGPDQLHICYCHSPIRYAWDLQHQYLQQANLTRGLKGAYSRATLHYMRLWDARTANGVDCFVANSRYIGRRILKVYRRSSTVIHPPVDVDAFDQYAENPEKADYYITVCRLVPYKRVDLIVDAFAQTPNRRLIVIGEGENLASWKKSAPSNVEFLGHQPDSSMRELLAKAKAFVYAAEEDFGISVVEAQACGTPVICLGRGGALDSVIPGKTGLFFDQQEAGSIREAIDRFEKTPDAFNTQEIRLNARNFSIQTFRDKFLELVSTEWKNHWESRQGGRAYNAPESPLSRSIPEPLIEQVI